MTYCKVNTTAYNPGKTIKVGERWPFHNQNLSTPELYKDMVKKLFEIERDTDPGVDMDSYMGVYIDRFNLYREWADYDGRKIKRGKFHVIYEARNGGNYQMFNKVYQLTNYDWYIFTCDDLMILGDEYYKKILSRWGDGVGYVALQGGGELVEGDVQHHVQGSIGLTSRKILEEVCNINNGELPHPITEPWTQEANIHEGEIPFTNKILELGYRFVNYNDSKEWLKENLCYPYYEYAQGK
jgi:hypothetical protein